MVFVVLDGSFETRLKKSTGSLFEEGDLQIFLAMMEYVEREASLLPQACVCHRLTESEINWQNPLFLGREGA